MATNGFASAPFTTYGSGGDAGANSIYLTKITLARAANAVAVLLQTVTGASPSLRPLIYDSAHSALVAQGITVTSMAAGYNRLAFSSPVALAAGTYYVGYVSSASLSVYIDGAQTGSSWWVSGGQSVTTPANPLVGGSSQNNGLIIALEFDGSAAAGYGFAPDYTAGITLSGGNTVATTTSSAQAARSVVTQTAAAAGKFYAEVVVGGTIGTSCFVGVSAANVCVTPPTTANSPWYGYMGQNGQIWINNVVSGVSGFTYVAGDVIGIAIDTSGSEAIWFNKNNGAWSNSGNPATGTGGINIGGPGGLAGWPLMLYCQSNSTTSFTLRDTSGSQQYARPSGFAPWSAFVSTAQARAMIMA